MKKPTVVVLNHDPIFLDLLTEVLTEDGYAVIPMNRSPNAHQRTLDDILALRPDAVFLDVQRECLTADWLLVRTLRRPPAGPPIPVLVSSTDHQCLQEQSAALAALGCFVLEKPFTLDQMEFALIQALSAACGPSAVSP